MSTVRAYPTQKAVSLANNAADTSGSLDCSNFRKFSLIAAGASGTCKVRLEVSYDGGTTWFTHKAGETSAANTTVMQIDDLVAPLCRVVATNTSGSTQTVSAFLCLASV